MTRVHQDFLHSPLVRSTSVGVRAMTLAVLASCEGSNDGKPDNQVAAKVNGEEIDVQQVNFVFQHTPVAGPERALEVREQILERLIEQQLLVQAAHQGKLERTPEVLQRFEAGRREIVTRAYLEKVADRVRMPDASEVTRFYNEQPELFRDRKVYTFDEIVLSAVPPGWEDLEKMLLSTKSVREAAAVLREPGIDAPAVTNALRASEQLPLAVLPQFARVKKGDVVIYSQPPAIVIAQVRSVRVEPIDGRSARPAIEQFLLTRKRGEAVQAEVKRLRESASVTYTGEFAVNGAASTSVASAAQSPLATLAAPSASTTATSADPARHQTSSPPSEPALYAGIDRWLKV